VSEWTLCHDQVQSALNINQLGGFGMLQFGVIEMIYCHSPEFRQIYLVYPYSSEDSMLEYPNPVAVMVTFSPNK